jgi:hypothetical protein
MNTSMRRRTGGMVLMTLVLLGATGPVAVPARAFPFGQLEGDAVLNLGFPQGELAGNIDNTGVGGHVTVGWAFHAVPVFVGLNAGAMSYGSETRYEPFSTTIPDVRVKVTTTNSIFYGHAVLRLGPSRGRFRPFADGLVGFKNFSTKTAIRNEHETSGEEPIAESTNLDDTAFSYGFGGGLRCRIATFDVKGTRKGEVDEKGTPLRVKTGEVHLHLTAGAWYLPGGEAQYLKKGSIRREGGAVTYDIRKSNTDMVFGFFGVSADF